MDQDVSPGSVDAQSAVEAQSHEDAYWYKDAVIYQLHIKAFVDSNDDGFGDFRGLTSKLDYIKDLGVNTVWLLPFYPSPMRDDGYDVADYHNIHPQYGTRNDFRQFVREAHRRDLRVITELVVNHTSDQHPWFQAARRAPPDSAKRDYYVWSDTDQKYRGTRIIFTDTESSNWTWDPVAKAYFWHRFFSHQPDLNFDNPKVLRAVFRAMRFWLDMGVDGFRLDVAEIVPLGFWREYRTFVRSINPEAYLVGEVWWEQWPERMYDPAPWLQGDVFDAVMNYRWYMPTRSFFAGAPPNLTATQYAAPLDSLSRGIAAAHVRSMMNLTASHDTPPVCA